MGRRAISRRPGRGAFAGKAAGGYTPPAGVLTQNGVSLASISSANYLSATGIVGPAWGAGTSLRAMFHLSSIPLVTQTIAQNGDAFARGWALYIDNTGQLVVFVPGAMTWNTGVILTTGYHSLSLTWDATTTNKLRLVVDGQTLVLHAIPTPFTAPNAASVFMIGNDSFGNALTSGEILEVSAYSSILSDADLFLTSSMGADNRWIMVPTAASEANVTFDWRASRDWDGVSATSTSGGSIPVVLTVNGAPTLKTFSEYLYKLNSLASQAYAWDSVFQAATSFGYQRSSMARFVVQTSDREIYYDSWFDYPGMTASNSEASNYTYLGVADDTTPAQTGLRRVDRVALPGGASVVDLWDDVQVRANGTSPTTQAEIYAIRTSVGGMQMSAPTLPGKRVTIYGDSITGGSVATVRQRDGWAWLLRNYLRGQDTGLNAVAASGRSLYDDITNQYASYTALATEIVAAAQQVRGGGAKVVVFSIGTNDYGFAHWNAAAFGAGIGSLLDAIHALDATITVQVVAPFLRTTETANAQGNTLDDYRAALSTAVSTRTGFATYTNGKTWIASGQVSGDGVHPTNAGHALIFEQALALLSVPAALFISQVTPSTVASTGGTALTVKGGAFLTGCNATVNGVAATCALVDAGSVTVTVPAHTGIGGPFDVKITNLNGQTGTATALTFAAPTNISCSPAVGTTTGGTAVTISGNYIGTSPTVTFGGVPATSIVRVDEQTITCVTPAGTLGAVAVVVGNSDGQTGSAVAFTYTKPTVVSILSNFGRAEGRTGANLIVRGTLFLDGTGLTKVTICGTDHTVASGDVTIQNAFQATVVNLAAHATAVGDVTVTVNGVTSDPLVNEFWYTPANSIVGHDPRKVSSRTGPDSGVTALSDVLTGSASVLGTQTGLAAPAYTPFSLVGNQPGLQFTGGGSPKGLVGSYAANMTSTSFTRILVAHVATYDATNDHLHDIGTITDANSYGTAHGYAFLQLSATSVEIFRNNVAKANQTVASMTGGLTAAWGVRFDGTNNYTRVNGVESAANAYSAAFNANRYFIGSTMLTSTYGVQPMTMDVALDIQFSVAWAAGDYAIANTWAQLPRWGVTF